MASVYQKRKTVCVGNDPNARPIYEATEEYAPTWYVDFRGPDGRRCQKATKATNKTEARKIAAEMERTAERQRLGLEPLPVNEGRTLAELAQDWLDKWCPVASVGPEGSRLRVHVIKPSLGALPLREVSPAVLDGHFRDLRASGLSAESVNHLRRTLRAIFNRARKQGEWVRDNPVSGTTPLPTDRYIPELLTPAEVERVLAVVNVEIEATSRRPRCLGCAPASPACCARRM